MISWSGNLRQAERRSPPGTEVVRTVVCESSEPRFRLAAAPACFWLLARFDTPLAPAPRGPYVTPVEYARDGHGGCLSDGGASAARLGRLRRLAQNLCRPLESCELVRGQRGAHDTLDAATGHDAGNAQTQITDPVLPI